MKWKSLFLSLFLWSPLFSKGVEQTLGIYDFSKGLDTYHSSLSLPDGFVADAQNVLFDAQAPVSKRQGFTVSFSSKAYAYQGAWTYTDSTNTSWIIVRASDSLIASNLAGSVVKISTVSANDIVDEDNAFGNAYFVDPTQAVYFWNGSTTTYVSGSPHGSLIAQFHSRVWVAGVALPNGNQLYGSGLLNGLNWALGPNASDPVQLTAGLQDNFDNITALYPYLDTLYTFKHYSIYSLTGFDQTNFQMSFITTECGCIDKHSIQAFGGSLKFVSLRGVENFDGYRCTRISEPVKDKVDPAIQVGSFAQSSWVQSQTSDWNAGTISPSQSLSTVIVAPALTLSTGTTSDPSYTANSGSETLTNLIVSTSILLNEISIPTNNFGNVNDNGFEIGSGGFLGPSWSTSGGWTSNIGGVAVQCSPNTGSGEAIGVGSPLVAALVDLNGNVLSSISQTITIPTGSCSSSPGNWPITTISSTGNVGKRIKVKFTDGLGNTLTTVNSYILGGDITFSYAGGKLSPGSHPSNIFIDGVLNGSSTISTGGSFISRVIDTGYFSETLIPSANWTINTSTPSFVLQDSANGTTFSDVTTSTGSNMTTRRYIRYLSTMTVSSSDNALSTFNSASFQWVASSGSIRSQVHNIPAINTWGNFSVSDNLNNGNISFSICSSSSVSMSPASCAVQTANAQIFIATNTFVQWYATFTVTAATQTPTLLSAAVQFFSGNKASPMSSTVWDNRYWLSLTTSTADSSNDAILVLNNSGSWADFNIHAGGLTQYKNSLYHADSYPTGNVYLDNQGYMDNGSAINAYIKTKDYTQGDLTEDNFLMAIWPSMDNLGNFNVSVMYFPDRSPVGFPLGQVAMSEFSNDASVKMQIPIDSTHQVFGKTFAYWFQASDANSPWNFYGLKEIFHKRVVQ